MGTVFDLLGKKEDDITYSVGWGLAQSEGFARALMDEVFTDDPGEITAVLLQATERGFGRTDIEIESKEAHLIVEAKRGWDLPSEDQLRLYAKRMRSTEERRCAIAVVSECSSEYPPVKALPASIADIPIHYIPWSRVSSLAERTIASCRSHIEKRVLSDLNRYLKGLMTSRDVTSNLVYVVSLNHDRLDWSDLTFVQTVMERDRYYHPIGGKGRWPKMPPNYLGFRFDGRLQRVSFVEGYEPVTRPHEHIPEIHKGVDWSDEPHFLYNLGPALPLPEHEVKSTGKLRSNRLWIALDLLLTCDTIPDAREKTKERLEKAGED